MIINNASLQALRTAFRADFQAGLGRVEAQRNLLAMTVPSTTAFNTYGWMKGVHGMREWIGPRQWNVLEELAYTLKNKTWESSVAVPREAMEDDALGIYRTLMQEMGMACAEHPEILVWNLLLSGFAGTSGLAWDGQYFFDSDHLTWDANGNETTFSNTGGGSGSAWFLADVSRPLKPIIFQERRNLAFVSKDRVDDDNVIDQNEYRYAADARYNAGYGMYQLIYGSKATLDADAVDAGRIALASQHRPDGSKMPLRPDTLFCGPSTYGAALKVAEAPALANGATNVWAGKYKVVQVPYLP